MKLFADYHVHSDVSPDSEAAMSSTLARARDAGIHEVCFTDHCDPDYPYDNWPLPDLDRYFNELEKAREAFPDLAVRAGTELGMAPTAREYLSGMVRNHPFDFVIMSRHVVGGVDPMAEDFFTDCPQREGERRYLEAILEDIRAFDDYDVIGHLGFVDRGLAISESLDHVLSPFTHGDFPDLLDEILKALVERGRGLEVNTSTVASLGAPLPNASILRRYAELGGDIVTVGSDAHRPEALGRGFKDAQDLLSACGLDYFCTFEGRKPTHHPIR